MKYNILVADDDREVLEAYQRALTTPSTPARTLRQALRITAPANEEIEFSVVTAHQGEAAFHLFREAKERGEDFDVVFLDMRMPPGWDGLRTAEAIREIDSDAFVIFVSAYTDRTMDELRLRLGNNLMMLRKPFSRQDISQCAYAISHQHRQRTELAELKKQLSILKELAEDCKIGKTGANILIDHVVALTLP